MANNQRKVMDVVSPSDTRPTLKIDNRKRVVIDDVHDKNLLDSKSEKNKFSATITEGSEEQPTMASTTGIELLPDEGKSESIPVSIKGQTLNVIDKTSYESDTTPTSEQDKEPEKEIETTDTERQTIDDRTADNDKAVAESIESAEKSGEQPDVETQDIPPAADQDDSSKEESPQEEILQSVPEDITEEQASQPEPENEAEPQIETGEPKNEPSEDEASSEQLAPRLRDAAPDISQTIAADAKETMDHPRAFDTTEYFVPIGQTKHRHGHLVESLLFGVVLSIFVLAVIYFYFL